MLILLLTDGTVFDTIDYDDQPALIETELIAFEYEATEDNGNHVYREVES